MAREQDYEWVNSWMASGEAVVAPSAAATMTAAAPLNRPAPPAMASRIAQAVAAKADMSKPASPERPRVAAPLTDQLARDLAEIERVRDALLAGAEKRQARTLTLAPTRTDSAPLFVGGMLALVMLTVFGVAAGMSKFGR